MTKKNVESEENRNERKYRQSMTMMSKENIQYEEISIMAIMTANNQ